MVLVDLFLYHIQAFFCSTRRIRSLNALETYFICMYIGERNHHCDMCDQKFKDSTTLSDHKKRKHLNIKLVID